MEMRLYLLLFLLFVLAACDRADRVEAPTAVETARLNEADAMLDNLAASANDEGPTTEVADPSNRSE